MASVDKLSIRYRTSPQRILWFVVVLGFLGQIESRVVALIFGAVGLVIVLLNPLVVQLVADKDGIRISNWFSGGSFRWSEVAELRLVQRGSRSLVEVVSTDGEHVRAWAAVTGSEATEDVNMAEVLGRLESFRRRAIDPAAESTVEDAMSRAANGDVTRLDALLNSHAITSDEYSARLHELESSGRIDLEAFRRSQRADQS